MERNVKKRFVHIIKGMAEVEGHVMAWTIILMMLLVIYEAALRYIIGKPPRVADEIGAYMLVFVAFGGLAYTWKIRGHVRITVLTSRINPKLEHRLRVATLAISLFCSILLTKFSYELMIHTYSMHILSTSWLEIPMEWPRGFVFLGFSLLSLHLIGELIEAITDIKQRG